jgi:hypothetical protein
MKEIIKILLMILLSAISFFSQYVIISPFYLDLLRSICMFSLGLIPYLFELEDSKVVLKKMYICAITFILSLIIIIGQSQYHSAKSTCNNTPMPLLCH